jgi:hypothetical protein
MGAMGAGQKASNKLFSHFPAYLENTAQFFLSTSSKCRRCNKLNQKIDENTTKFFKPLEVLSSPNFALSNHSTESQTQTGVSVPLIARHPHV